MLQLHPTGLFRVRSGFLVISMTLLTWSYTTQSGTPGGLSARPGDRKIELSWSYVDAPVTWNVKRSLSDSGPYSLISSLRTNAFSDTSVSNGIPYYYRITISWPDLGQTLARTWRSIMRWDWTRSVSGCNSGINLTFRSLRSRHWKQKTRH